VGVQLGNPAVGEILRRTGILPAKTVRYFGGASSLREAGQPRSQQLEEPAGKEVTMSVADAHQEHAIIIGLVSDTHGLIRNGLFEALSGVSQILHAGDVGGRPILDALSVIAPVLAVCGNVDPMDGLLPDAVTIDAGGLSLHVSHGHELGSPVPAKLLARYAADIIVFGHTHRPLVHREGNRLVVNPGAAGPRRFDIQPSVGILRIANGKAEVEIVPLRG
jgi:putative phosphoesterase